MAEEQNNDMRMLVDVLLLAFLGYGFFPPLGALFFRDHLSKYHVYKHGWNVPFLPVVLLAYLGVACLSLGSWWYLRETPRFFVWFSVFVGLAIFLHAGIFARLTTAQWGMAMILSALLCIVLGVLLLLAALDWYLGPVVLLFFSALGYPFLLGIHAWTLNREHAAKGISWRDHGMYHEEDSSPA